VAGARTVAERDAGAPFPFLVHPEWAEQLPWLAQGITARNADSEYDMTLFGGTPARTVHERWAALRQFAGLPTAVHARQVHGARVIIHRRSIDSGLIIADRADGHVTADAGLLLTVSVADCVPVTIVDVARRTVAILHAGWRGAAAGILERGVDALVHAGSTCADLRLHLGPAICGACYEVGLEVHAALGLPVPPSARPIDLRGILAARAAAAGIAADAMTTSAHCTRCGPVPLHSHRAGSAARQIAVAGLRGGAAESVEHP
jgi:YfiH family protein